jgi:AcrR family transcriptional regulator
VSGKTAGARASIIAAFNRLVLARRVLKPPVADVLSEAEVARSTFYEHFDSRDSLLIESLRAPLAIVADAAAGTGDVERLEGLLDHFREQKRGAAELLASPLVRRLVRLLAELICERAPALAPNAALRLADQQLGLIRLWITGETPCRARDLAATMAASATAQRRALADNP